MNATSELSGRLSTWTGLDLERGIHARVLDDVIERRAQASGVSVGAYVERLRSPDDSEAARLIDFLTVCHSWFFRDGEQIDIVERILLEGRSDPNIWVAGCASGEEAYTIAMLADSLGRKPYILATDINTEALMRARAGRYGRWSLEHLRAGFADRFTPDGAGTFELEPKVRALVELRRHNLMDPVPLTRTGAGWDLILCRNVLMYFRPADAGSTITRMGVALRPGGYLILGASDILPEAPHPLRFVTIGSRHVLQSGPASRPPVKPRAMTQPMWIPPPPVPSRTQPPVLRQPVRAADTAAVTDVLVAGVRAFEAGDFARAVAHCSVALERDPLCPEAALLIGIACFLDGDTASALANLRRALVLDPALWHGELYLAMCHERLGRTAEATNGYRRLLALLTAPPARTTNAALASLETWRTEALSLARHKVRATTMR